MSSKGEIFNTGQRSPLVKILRAISSIVPGNFLKTFVYLNFIEKPRRAMRLSLSAFYRIDHIYSVLSEFATLYQGQFSILEFGTSDGYAFTKMLYATKYLKLEQRVLVHTFDSFEGMPAPADAKDINIISRDSWVEGEFKGRYEQLSEYCAGKYSNYRIHKGYFQQTLTPQLLETLKSQPPILVWFDCDYYSSARTAFERIAPFLPNGCVIYFDEYEQLNFGSRFTGEARLVHEVNQGLFGDDLELVLDPKLSLDTKRIYRFIRCGSPLQFKSRAVQHVQELVHWRNNDSAFP